MKTIFIILISFVIAGCSGSSSNSVPTQKVNLFSINKNPGIGPIAVVGDSLAAGYKATDSTVKPAGCLARLPNTGMHNYAIPGLTSAQILFGIPTALLRKPHLVFVSSGGNDTMNDADQPGIYPVQKTYAEMSEMFDKLITSGALVVYLGLNPGMVGAERLPEVSNMAKAKGVIVVDGMNGFWQNPKLMADQIHPNNAGYSIMCDRILNALQGQYP